MLKNGAKFQKRWPVDRRRRASPAPTHPTTSTDGRRAGPRRACGAPSMRRRTSAWRSTWHRSTSKCRWCLSQMQPAVIATVADAAHYAVRHWRACSFWLTGFLHNNQKSKLTFVSIYLSFTSLQKRHVQPSTASLEARWGAPLSHRRAACQDREEPQGCPRKAPLPRQFAPILR